MAIDKFNKDLAMIFEKIKISLSKNVDLIAFMF